ncbi:hypothetical protein CLOM_g10994 [Closterium sp. NIES-68]|nr:hypothetical protein CLOM_g10994 [Closterium sp. NIES-68]GJP71152.1 hypothetical protein CLOP_g2000 [Closterium sp. NIES-67]
MTALASARSTSSTSGTTTSNRISTGNSPGAGEDASRSPGAHRTDRADRADREDREDREDEAQRTTTTTSRERRARLGRHGTATMPCVVWSFFLVGGLLSVLGLAAAPCAADDTVREWSMPEGKNLTLHVLADNPYGAKCLDGSPPGYFFRRGSGAGKQAWHIFLPGGGWCASADDCAARASTAMGSTRPWTPRRKSARRLAVLFKGILSPTRRRNPNFHDWNLVVPLYCDGGGYAGRAGWRQVNESTSIYMDGWRIMKAVLSDLMDQRGLKSATQVLLSGCSAGGQAVVMLCDQVETLLPSATVKCLMDGGFFLDARDRNDKLRFRSLVQRIASLHQATGNARCGRAHEDEEKWRCFFPQYSLGYVASTIFVVNPLFDYAALSIGNQLPNKTSSIARCLHDLTVDMPSLTESIRNNSWSNMTYKENSPCSEDEQKAVLTVAGVMYNEVKALVKKERRVAAYLLDTVAHCSTVYSSWSKIRVNGVTVRKAIGNWYFDSDGSDESRFLHP